MKFSNITPIALAIFMLCGLGHIENSWAQAKKKNTDAKQLKKIFKSNQILKDKERKQLGRLLEMVDQNKYQSSYRQEILTNVQGKLEKDKLALQVIIERTESLKKNKFGRKSSKIKSSVLSAIEKRLDNLQVVDRSARNKKFKHQRQKKDDGYYLNNIKKYSALLTGEGGSENVSDIWKDLRNVIEPSYAAWNERYVQLKQGVESHSGRDYYGYDRNLSYEESQFVELFKELQAIVRRVSEDQDEVF